MKLMPLDNRVIIKPDEAQETTAGGLYIATDSKERPQTGTIVAVGEGRMDEKGEMHPMPVKSGDRVMFGKYGGTEIDQDGETVIIMRIDDVLAVFAD